MKVQSRTEKYQKTPKTEVTMTKKAKVSSFFSTYTSTWPCRFAAGKKELTVNFIYSYSLFLCSALIWMGLSKSDSKTWTEKNPLWSKWFSHAMIVVGLHCGWVNSFFPNRTPRFYVQYVTDAANDKYPQYNFLFQFLPPFNPICQNFFSYYFLL